VTDGVGVYMLWQVSTGKAYVGSSVSFRRRWNKHLSQLKRGNHHSPHLQRAWTKYGEADFRFDVLEYVQDVRDLLSVEQEWLDALGAFNTSRRASSRLGVRVSDETRAKISKAHKGRKKSAQERQAHLEGVRNMPAEARQRIVDGCKVYARSSAALEKIRRLGLSRRGSVWSEAQKARLSASKQGVRLGAQSAEHLAKRVASRRLTLQSKREVEGQEAAAQRLEARRRRKNATRRETYARRKLEAASRLL